MGIKIIGSGSYLPSKIITNDELSLSLDTDDHWIKSRTGIQKRHICDNNQTSADLGLMAAKLALSDANLKPEQIDLIIVATTTPDYTFPSNATKIQGLLGLKSCPSFDIQAVCSGFIYGIHISKALLNDPNIKKILLISTEKMSSIIDWNDRSTAIIFGDGAGAIILENSSKYNANIIASEIFSDGSLLPLLHTNGGTATTKSAGTIKMEGREVFKHAIDKMSSAILNLLKKTSYTIDQINIIIPHQANLRIIEAIANKLSVNLDKFIITISTHGNCSAASIPLALDYAKKNNLIRRGDLVLFTALGAGLTWGATLIKY